jgi:hypothetical protein
MPACLAQAACDHGYSAQQVYAAAAVAVFGAAALAAVLECRPNIFDAVQDREPNRHMWFCKMRMEDTPLPPSPVWTMTRTTGRTI